MKHLTFSRLLPWILLVAVLLAFGYCGNQYRNDMTAWKARQADYDSLLTESKAAAREATEQAFDYHNNAQVAADATRRAQDSSNRLKREVRELGARVRLLAGIADAVPDTPYFTKTPVGTTWTQDNRVWFVVTDTGVVRLDPECCRLGALLANKSDSLIAADSVKDVAFNAQLSLATGMIDAQAGLLQDATKRFNHLDVLYQEAAWASKPRAKILLGLSGGASPGFAWAGIAGALQTRKGVQYQVHAGPANTGGMYYGATLLKTISLRKRR